MAGNSWTHCGIINTMKTFLFLTLLCGSALAQFPFDAFTQQWLQTNAAGGVNIGFGAGAGTPNSDATRIGFGAGSGAGANLLSSVAIGRHALTFAIAPQTVGVGHAVGQYAGLGGAASDSFFGGYLAARNSQQLTPHYAFVAVVIGAEAATTTKSLQASTLLGARSASTAQSAVCAAMLGYGTGSKAINADSSVLLGCDAGGGADYLSRSIYIGPSAGYAYSRNNTLIVESNATFTGAASLIYGEFDTRRLRFNATTMGFFGAPAVTRPTVTGSWSDGTALISLLDALHALGLVTDQTIP